MNEPDYEYRGLMVATWDTLRGDTSRWGDRAAFREMIARHGQPALDVGCATGRLLLDYLAEGIDIDGVDLSPEMLDRCREKVRHAGSIPPSINNRWKASISRAATARSWCPPAPSN